MIMFEAFFFKKAQIKRIRKKKLPLVYFFCALLVLPINILAQQNQPDELDLSTTIEGNRESPKVLYIIPWAPPQDPGDIDPFSPHNGNMARRIYAPIERLEQQRLLRYYDDINQQESNLE